MAEIEKFTDDSVRMLLKHSERELKNDSNTDIAESRTDLNYSIELNHDGPDLKYYQELLDETYVYGRGSRREAEAVTCCSWVITLPKEISDYSDVGKDHSIYLNHEKERQFFQGAVDFVSERYGPENIVHAKCHYDEGGQPHVHIYFVPRKSLDHDQVHFKTSKTRNPIRTETGRWEYSVQYKTDENGNRIPLKNCSKLSDYYDFKLAAAEIVNPCELKHFHPDFAEYLRDHNLPGADSVHTGATGGKNISVSSLKELTRTTGLTLNQIQEVDSLRKALSEARKELQDVRKEYTAALEEIEHLRQGTSREWGRSSGWGKSKGWGHVERDTTAWEADQTK